MGPSASAFRASTLLAVSLVAWLSLAAAGAAWGAQVLVCGPGPGAGVDAAARERALAALDRAGIDHEPVRLAGGRLTVEVPDARTEAAREALRQALAPGLVVTRGVPDGARASGVREALGVMLGALLGQPPAAGGYLLLELDAAGETGAPLDEAVQRTLGILRARAEAMGARVGVERRGSRRIAVQLEGAVDPARVLDVVAATATVELHWVDTEQDPDEVLASGQLRAGTRLYQDREGRPVVLEEAVIVGGEHVADATSGLDQATGQPTLFVALDAEGAARMRAATAEGIGRPMAVLHRGRDAAGEPVEEVVSVARVREPLGRRFMVSGLEDRRTARDLALLLRAGALPAPLTTVERCTWGAAAPGGAGD
jgi:protein-export membrane protein SecD